MGYEIRTPDVEVIVGAAGSDVAVFCFYKRDDIHHGYEVVCAVAGASARPVIRQVLQDCLTALNTENWNSLDELDQGASEEEGGKPF